MNQHQNEKQNRKIADDAYSPGSLAIELGEALLERAREVGHEIEDRVQRALAHSQSEATESRE